MGKLKTEYFGFFSINTLSFIMLLSIFLIASSCDNTNKSTSNDIEIKQIMASGSNLIQKNVDSAIIVFKELVAPVYDLNQSGLTARLHKEMGLAFFVKGYFNLAIDQYKLGLAFAIKEGDVDMQSRLLNNIGVCYTNLSEYSLAIDAFSELLQICIETSDKDGYNMCLLNLAHLNSKLGLYDIAITQLNEVIKYFKLVNKSNLLAVCFNIYGNIAGNQGNVNKEIEEYQKSLDIFIRLRDTSSYASCLRELSLAYAKKGDEKNAMKYYHTRCSLNASLQSNFESGDAEFLLGDINSFFNRHHESLISYENALHLFTTMKNNAMQLLAIKKIFKIFGFVGMPDGSQYLITRYDSLQNAINEKQNIARAAELSALLDSKLIRQQLEHEKALRLRHQRNLITISIIGFILLFVIITVFLLYHKLNISHKELFLKNLELLRIQEDISGGSVENMSEVEREEKSLLKLFHRMLVEEQLYADENLTLPFAAQKLGTNQRYLSFAINQTTGLNFNTYVNKIRISFAQEKLINMNSDTSLTNEELAIQVGFSNRSTFFRAFKQITGLSPSQYKDFLKQKANDINEQVDLSL